MAALHRRGRSRGQGLVEFALVLPVFMAILIGMVDLGRAVWANNNVGNAAREAARFAVVHGGSCKDFSGSCSTSTYCPVGPPGPKTAVPTSSTFCPYPSPSKTAVRNIATGFLVAGGTGVTVTVCYGTSCSGDTDTSGANNLRGSAVTVVVSTQVPMVLASLLGFSTMTVSATSTMLVNH